MFEFIETPFFTKALSHYLEDDEYAKLQNYLNEQPEAGVIVPDSGGELWMLTIYGKNVREDIPAHALRQMKENIDDA
jgi:hypothetical protein